MNIIKKIQDYLFTRRAKKDPNMAYNQGPVHEWFGLTYSNYFVLPRRLLQSMPWEWQEKFVDLMVEFEDSVGYVYDNDGSSYAVTRKTINGKFAHDPLSNYKRVGPIPPRK